MEITSQRAYEQFSLYFDKVLHLRLKLNDLIGFQSWVHGEKEFYIQFYFTVGEKITVAYDTKEKWIEVLQHLEAALK